MNRDHLKTVQLKYRKSKDTNLPHREQVRKRPYILFSFQDPDTGKRYTKTKTIEFVDLHNDFENGIKVAQEYYESLCRKLALDTLNLKSVFPVNRTITLKEFFGIYLEEREKAVNRGSLSAGTLRADMNASNRFKKSLGDSYPLQAVSEKTVYDYIDGQLRAGYAKSTINIDIRHLGGAMGKAVKSGLIDENPFADVKELPVEKIPRHLWPEEEAELRKYFREIRIPHQQDFFEFDISTGLRVEEIFNANLGKIRQEEIHVLGKGNKWRWIPLGKNKKIIERRQDLISDGRRLRDYLFDLKGVTVQEAVNRAEKGHLFFEITELTSFAHFIQKARRRCSLPDKVKPHCLRHTYAVRFLEGGGDIYLLSKLMGHSSVKVTEIYLECTPELRKRLVVSG
jgi:site-specific recombinase XerD